jgi:twitching motility protein PilT
MDDALRVASSPHDFKLLVAAEGRTATSMDDLVDSSSSERSSVGPETLRNPVPVGAPAQPNGSPPPPPSAPPSGLHG